MSLTEFSNECIPRETRDVLDSGISLFETVNIEIQVLADNGDEAASISIIESINPTMEFTLHLKDEVPSGKYIVSTSVYYYEGEGHQAAGDSFSKEYQLQPLTEVQVVDRQQVIFTLTHPPETG